MQVLYDSVSHCSLILYAVCERVGGGFDGVHVFFFVEILISSDEKKNENDENKESFVNDLMNENNEKNEEKED
jgi:hypothetical protein